MKRITFAFAGLCLLFLAAGAAFGATFVVTKTADTNDGVCDADCSFREAVARVNANTAGGIRHRIEFSALFDTPQTILLNSPVEVDYNTHVEIIGRGNRATTITIAGIDSGSALVVNSDFARVYALRFANSQNPGIDGGALTGNDGGELIVENCVFENNVGAQGGAIYVSAFSFFTIRESTFRNNQAAGSGGAVVADNYDQTITGSTFSGNQSTEASAVLLLGVGAATTSEINNSTFTGNISTNGSTVVHGFNSGLANLRNITVANNTTTAAAVFSVPSANVTNLGNSIVSLNSGGQINSSVGQPGPNLIGGSPLLGPLAFNGGETETLALLPGSPAINAGVGGLPFDQRGVARPQGAAPDLGAFEKGPTIRVVTKTADTDDGVCDADCSLREAMSVVEPAPAVNQIRFSRLFDTPRTIALSTPVAPVIDTVIDVIGSGNRNVTLTSAAGGTGPLLGFNVGAVRLMNLRFANATSGAVVADASDSKNQIPLDLEIERCLFENNSAALSGAAIASNVVYGSVAIRDSTFRNNTAGDAGGAVFISESNWSITGSTFAGNTAPFGSAIFAGENANQPTTITNSTFSGNHSPSNAFGIRSATINVRGRLDLLNVTIAGNTADSPAANSAVVLNDQDFNAQTRIRNSIVADNSFTNLNASVTQTGPNLIGGTPLLGSLAFNGGETETLALLAGSPAIDAGSSVNAPAVDQRGAARPQGAGIDLGALESGVAVTSAATPTGSNVNGSLGTVSVTFAGVTQSGTTTQIPVSPTGAPPAGYSFGAGFPAFQISTTAQYTAPVTLCIAVPLSTPLATFQTLSILHFENGSWVALAPTTRNELAYTICAPTNSLSPFAIGQAVVPTSANVEISGRVLAGRGPVPFARVSLTDANGVVRTTVTNSFGAYSFRDVAVGIYTVSVSAKALAFNARVLNLSESIQELDFYPTNPESKTDGTRGAARPGD